MRLYITAGHDTSALDEIEVELRVEKYPEWTKEPSSDGIFRNVGGGSATLIGEALSYDEMALLLTQLGLSLSTPSVLCTVTFLDLFRVPIPYFGVVTINVTETEGAWWKNVRFEFTGLVEAS